MKVFIITFVKNKKKSQKDKKFDEIIKICDLDRFIKNITNKSMVYI